VNGSISNVGRYNNNYIITRANGWMDGWMGGWMDRWMDIG
jgi:hypothetical protein